jgi:hypothetical protein
MHRFVGSRDAQSTRTLLATAGDRLALEHILWTGPVAGPVFEVEALQLIEVDAQGRFVAVIAFDTDERRAASAEMSERYAGSDAAARIPPSVVEFERARRARDLERMRAVLPSEFVFHDHRRTGAGRLAGADDYVAWMASLFEQSSDAIIERLYIVAAEKHGDITVGRTFGSLADGGEFELFFIALRQYQGDRWVRTELFEVEDLATARAQFEALRPDPMRIPPNAACRVRDRTGTAFDARDWPALRSLTSADFTFEDRRRWNRLAGNVELWIKSLEQLRSLPALRRSTQLIGTVGDRIALHRIAWTGEAPDGGAVEYEEIRLTEIDADGRLRASINYDLDDRRAAFDEAQARFVNGQAAGCDAQALIRAFGDTIARHDWDHLRKYFADGLVCRDHRRLSFGEIPVDKLIESLHVLSDLGPDVRGEQLQILAWNDRGRVSAIRQFGTLRDGGGFETVFVPVLVVRDGCIIAYELFDAGEVDQAVACFEELCSDRA